MFMFLTQKSTYNEVLMVIGKQGLVFLPFNFALGVIWNGEISQLLLTYYLCFAESYCSL